MLAAALTRDRLNNTVRDEHDIEKAVGARPLGRIPHDGTLGAARTIGFGAPAAAAAEAFQHLRTALSVAHPERSYATILVTALAKAKGSQLSHSISQQHAPKATAGVDVHLIPQGCCRQWQSTT